MNCYKCQNLKSDVPQPPQTNAMDDTRSEIEQMMAQLQQERAVIADIVQPILDELIDLAVLESEGPPPASFPESPGSPVYQPPEEEDEEMGSAQAGETVSYECSECQMMADAIFEVMMHLEEDHGFEEDEEILKGKIKEIKMKQ